MDTELSTLTSTPRAMLDQNGMAANGLPGFCSPARIATVARVVFIALALLAFASWARAVVPPALLACHANLLYVTVGNHRSASGGPPTRNVQGDSRSHTGLAPVRRPADPGHRCAFKPSVACAAFPKRTPSVHPIAAPRDEKRLRWPVHKIQSRRHRRRRQPMAEPAG